MWTFEHFQENNKRGHGIFMWTWDKFLEKNKHWSTFIWSLSSIWIFLYLGKHRYHYCQFQLFRLGKSKFHIQNPVCCLDRHRLQIHYLLCFLDIQDIFRMSTYISSRRLPFYIYSFSSVCDIAFLTLCLHKLGIQMRCLFLIIGVWSYFLVPNNCGVQVI